MSAADVLKNPVGLKQVFSLEAEALGGRLSFSNRFRVSYTLWFIKTNWKF